MLGMWDVGNLGFGLLQVFKRKQTFFMKNSSVFKVDIPPTMLSSNKLIKFLILLKKSSSL